MAKCRRWYDPSAPSLGLPVSITESKLAALGEQEAVSTIGYQECDGNVPCTYHFEPETSFGDYGATPASEDFEVGECDTCGASDWTEEEREQFLEDERNAQANYDGDEEPDDD